MKTNLLTCLVLVVVLLFALPALSQYDPHPKGINYSEDFRGQYHFSPKSEWMNDINALMYADTKTWTHQVIQSSKDKNILEGVASKTFDLTAEFDLNGATAREIEFKIANKTVNYNIETQELLGKALKPDTSNRLKIRMLVDWGQLEIFAASGVFSYSQQFAFTPDDSSLGLYTHGGEVKLVSLELNEVARTWPKKPN